MKAIGIAFKVPERSINKLMKYSDGLNEGFLPVPSVFVVDTSRKIEFEYINPTYKTRLGADFLFAVLNRSEFLKMSRKHNIHCTGGIKNL